MIDEIIKKDRFLRICHTELLNKIGDNTEPIAIVGRYLNDYAAFHNLSSDFIINSYKQFVATYNEDVENFLKTKKYPFENKLFRHIDRISYDVALILSTLVGYHRFRMMDLIKKMNFNDSQRILCIGVGAGVELSVIKKADIPKIVAFDPMLSPFIRHRFPEADFNEILYKPSRGKYDVILAIEFIEHVKKPYEYLADFYNSLIPGGKLIITTAGNVPQFDHLYNFKNDIEFETKALYLGFVLINKIELRHGHSYDLVGAKNTFYTLGTP